MASKASIGGHPVHPMIIPFPLALWTTSFVTDLLFYFTRNATLPLIAKFLLAGGCIGSGWRIRSVSTTPRTTT